MDKWEASIQHLKPTWVLMDHHVEESGVEALEAYANSRWFFPCIMTKMHSTVNNYEIECYPI